MTTPTLLKPFNAWVFFTTLRGVLIVAPWLLHLFVTDIALSALLPVSFFDPTIAYNICSKLASLVWLGIQVIFTKLNRARITTSGDTLPRHESALVIANHVSWTDFYLIQHLAIRAGMLGRCRWFAKQQLKWVPFLGWGLWAMGMPLLSRRWNKDQEELDRVFRGPKQFKWPIWLISYSEATRYTPQKYLETVQWCKANHKPIPRYTLYPRTKGFITTVKELGTSSSIKAVYDLTLGYAHQGRFLEAPTIWDTLSQPDLDKDWRFHVHVERVELKDLAGKSDSELATWLESRWMEKSRRLQKLQGDLEEGMDWSESAPEDSKNK